MALFRKKSEAEKDLFARCAAVGGAAVDGDSLMLNHYLESAEDIRRLFLEVTRTDGIKIAKKSSLGAADFMANYVGRQLGDTSAIPGRKADEVMKRLLSGLLDG